MPEPHHQVKGLSIGSEPKIILLADVEILHLYPQQLGQLGQKLFGRSLPYLLPTGYDRKKELKNQLMHVFEAVLELLLKSKNSAFSSYHMFHLVPKVSHLSQHWLTENFPVLQRLLHSFSQKLQSRWVFVLHKQKAVPKHNEVSNITGGIEHLDRNLRFSLDSLLLFEFIEQRGSLPGSIFLPDGENLPPFLGLCLDHLFELGGQLVLLGVTFDELIVEHSDVPDVLIKTDLHSDYFYLNFAINIDISDQMLQLSRWIQLTLFIKFLTATQFWLPSMCLIGLRLLIYVDSVTFSPELMLLIQLNPSILPDPSTLPDFF